MNTLDTYLQASGSREIELELVISNAKKTLVDLKNSFTAYNTKQREWRVLANNYWSLSYDDWKHRNKYNGVEYGQMCSAGQCMGQHKSGRKNRFDSRYRKWMKDQNTYQGYKNKSLDILNKAIPAQENLIETAINALKSYREALNDKVSQGHSPESAAQFAENEIQAQNQALLNSQQQADATAKAIESAPRQKIIKIAIIGGIILVGGFILLRLKK